MQKYVGDCVLLTFLLLDNATEFKDCITCLQKCYAILLSLLADILLFLTDMVSREGMGNQKKQRWCHWIRQKIQKANDPSQISSATSFSCDPSLIHEVLSDLCLCDHHILLLLPDPPIPLPQGMNASSGLRLFSRFAQDKNRKAQKR